QRRLLVVLLRPCLGITHLGHVVLPGQAGGEPCGIKGNLLLGHSVISSVGVSTTDLLCTSSRAARRALLCSASASVPSTWERRMSKNGNVPAMPKTADQLRRLTSAILAAGGSAGAEADLVADHLVQANLAGHDSHGVGMVPAYVRHVKAGLVVPNTRAK